MTKRCITRMAILAATAVTTLACSDDPTSTISSMLGARQGGVGPGGICRGEGGTPLPTAPRSARVDLVTPSFSNPTDVTNPLFPVSRQERVLLFGAVDGEPLRIEVTLLAGTRVIAVKRRQQVETLVSQFVAFVGGRLHEVAIDHYAQADDGAVWYFGEDVFNYADGAIVDTEGTWLAGSDGPAAMIMPADAKVGDVWRPENICGLVFEEVTAKSTGVTVNGPRGPVQGALVVEELHMDGTLEAKTFARGYGEFTSGAGDNLEALALAVPTDALSGPTPAALEALATGAAGIFDAAQSGDWNAASAAVGTMTFAWNAFQAGDVPSMLKAQMSGALDALVAAVSARNPAPARQAAVNVARASLDLQLRHRPRAEIDLALLDLWARQILIDVAAHDRRAVLGDIATLKWIRDRIADDLASADLRRLDAQLGGLPAAVTAQDLVAAAHAAARLRYTLARTQVTGRRI